MKEKEAVTAAIMGAVNAYIQQEEQARAAIPGGKPYPEISPWRLFGRQELMRARTRWRITRVSR